MLVPLFLPFPPPQPPNQPNVNAHRTNTKLQVRGEHPSMYVS